MENMLYIAIIVTFILWLGPGFAVVAMCKSGYPTAYRFNMKQELVFCLLAGPIYVVVMCVFFMLGLFEKLIEILGD